MIRPSQTYAPSADTRIPTAPVPRVADARRSSPARRHAAIAVPLGSGRRRSTMAALTRIRHPIANTTKLARRGRRRVAWGRDAVSSCKDVVRTCEERQERRTQVHDVNLSMLRNEGILRHSCQSTFRRALLPHAARDERQAAGQIRHPRGEFVHRYVRLFGRVGIHWRRLGDRKITSVRR